MAVMLETCGFQDRVSPLNRPSVKAQFEYQLDDTMQCMGLSNLSMRRAKFSGLKLDQLEIYLA